MDLNTAKPYIKSFYKSGFSRVEAAELLNGLDLNGHREDAINYLHELYAAENLLYAKNLTDTGNAERLVTLFGDKVHYCYDRKKWLIFNDRYWDWDNGYLIMEMAKSVARSIYREAADEPDDKKRDLIAKYAHTSESESKRKAMVDLAQSEPNIPIELSEIDSNSWLFNCANGTIDLKTGELKEHSKDDLLTIISPIDYDPKAKCDLWLKFLERVTGNKTDLISYLQRAVGYSLTGDTSEQCLFFLYGLGRNGKSTCIGTVRKLLGPYGHKTNTDMLMVRDRNGGPREDLADLKGKRLVVASEIEDGKRLAVVLIKEMTGGESIRADRKHEHAFEFVPTHKIWLSGNHKPVITDTTFSIWRRVKLIPFTVTIPESECDPDLPLKLEKEMPGILAWAVQGCLDWQKYRLGDSTEVKQATEAYRAEQDLLAEFIEDCCILKPSGVVAKADLYQSYKDWCDASKQTPISQRSFRGKIVERGIEETRGTAGVRQWSGITLTKKPEEKPQLIPESDRSDTSGVNLHEKTAVFSREVVKPEKSVTNVTNVTNVTHKHLEYDKILGFNTAFIVDFWKNMDCPVVAGVADIESLLNGPDATIEQLEEIKKWVTTEDN